MLKVILTSTVMSLLLCSAARGQEVIYQGEISPLNITPTFDNGFLVAYGPRVTVVYSRDGAPVLSLKSPENTSVWNVAVDTDGAVARAVEHRPNSTGEILIADRSGSPINSIDTKEFVPTQVCFAPDHSVWVTGGPVIHVVSETPDFPMLRHYSRDGKELGAFLPRSSIPSVGHQSYAVIGLWGLRIANNRIGAIIRESGDRTLWIELDMSGKELGRWPIDIDGLPAAFTSKGTVYAWGVGEILALDRGTGKWVRDSSVPSGILIGADGSNLVFADPRGNRTYSVAVNR